MTISKKIKFEDLERPLYIRKGDDGFDELLKINSEGLWTEYVNQELTEFRNTVRYDYQSNTFVVIPLENRMLESFGFDDNFDIEGNYEEEEKSLTSNELIDLINTVLPDAVNNSVRDSFEKLRNEIYNSVSPVNNSNEQENSNINLEKVKLSNNEEKQSPENFEDSELALGDYDSNSSFSFLDKEETMHPDLARFLNPKDLEYSYDEDKYEEQIIPDEDLYLPEEEQEAITCNETKDINGVPVTLILTGVMISMPELEYIQESVSKHDLKLSKIYGKGNELKIIAENANGFKYKIKYSDNATFNNFEVEKAQFNTLNESLDFVTKNKKQIETDNFKRLMNENLLNRKFDSKKEANSLDILNNVNESYKVKQWGVKEVGLVNLKNGLNENYSDITKIGKAQNTLLKNEEGDYVLLKGNLQEATNKGTKAELLEARKTKIVSYGNYEVVGKYDNTLEGLGDIMFECKKSAIPLLFFKG